AALLLVGLGRLVQPFVGLGEGLLHLLVLALAFGAFGQHALHVDDRDAFQIGRRRRRGGRERGLGQAERESQREGGTGESSPRSPEAPCGDERRGSKHGGHLSGGSERQQASV